MKDETTMTLHEMREELLRQLYDETQKALTTYPERNMQILKESADAFGFNVEKQKENDLYSLRDELLEELYAETKKRLTDDPAVNVEVLRSAINVFGFCLPKK